MQVQTLNMLVHGEAKVGKSWLAATAPAPRLILDAEGGARYTPGRKIVWEPSLTPPPEVGEWDTCLVVAHTFDTLSRVYQWLYKGVHPFNSVVFDQVTEIQKRVITHFNGTSSLREADWGTILREMEDLIRKYRDLAVYSPMNVRTLQASIFLAGTKLYDGGKYRPFLMGQLRDYLPYMVDVTGYYYTEVNDFGQFTRKLLIHDHPQFVAGDRTDALSRHYGSTIENPNITDMLSVLTTSANT